MALRVSVLAFLGPVVGPRWVRATCALYSPSPGLCRAHACPAQSALSPSWPARSSRRPDVLPIFLRACVWVFPGHVRVLSKSVCGLFVPDSRLDTCCPYVEASAISRRPPRRPDITYWSACTQCTLFCSGLRPSQSWPSVCQHYQRQHSYISPATVKTPAINRLKYGCLEVPCKYSTFPLLAAWPFGAAAGSFQ